MLNLSPEQNALFSILRNEKVNNATFVDWDEVRKEALAQAVFLLLAKSECLPTEIAKSWRTAFHAAMRDNIEAFYAITEMDRVMRSAGEKYIILKGLAASSYYPNPMLRALGDVDFLIDPEHRTIVDKAFVDDGYERDSEEIGYHTGFYKDQQILEMHITVPGMPKNELSGYIKAYFNYLLDEPILYYENGAELKLPQSKYHGVILILHTLHHMLSSGFGLRHLMDWGYFVQKTEKEEFWREELLPILEKVGLLHFAQVLTKTSAIYLHTASPDWIGIVDEVLCDSLMKDILTGGNFGRKEQGRLEHSKYILNRSQGGVGGRNGFTQAIDAVFVKSKKEGRSVAAILFEYAGKIVRGERKLDSAEVVRDAIERKKIYEQLHLFEV